MPQFLVQPNFFFIFGTLARSLCDFMFQVCLVTCSVQQDRQKGLASALRSVSCSTRKPRGRRRGRHSMQGCCAPVCHRVYVVLVRWRSLCVVFSSGDDDDSCGVVPSHFRAKTPHLRQIHNYGPSLYICCARNPLVSRHQCL